MCAMLHRQYNVGTVFTSAGILTARLYESMFVQVDACSCGDEFIRYDFLFPLIGGVVTI